MVAERSARHERTQAINQARALIMTGPDELRARFAGHTPAALAAAIAALRPRPGDVPGYATRVALRELGRRVQFLDAQQPSQRVQRGRDVQAGMGVHAAGADRPVFYDGHSRPFRG